MDHFLSDGDDMRRKPLWLRPASHPGDDDSVSTPPETVLLDTLAYIDDETNATTADETRSDGQSKIQVTFWIAHPPRVSYLTVHCPGLKPDAFPLLPRIVATEDDLALLHVPVCPQHLLGDDRRSEFFIYRAGTGNQRPLLRLLPNPSPRIYGAREVGILSCRPEDRFFIAVLCRIPSTRPEKHYINLFDSKTWTWDTKQVHVNSPDSCSHTITHKVITIGGRRGSMGWVDLWHGILIYDVLLGNNMIRYIPLPSSLLPTLEGMSRTVRDIVVVNGFIKCFCMYCPGIHTTNISGDWQADAWRVKDPWENWQHDCHLKASEIMVDNPKHSELLPDLPDGVEKPVLTTLRAGSPVLSLHDDDVVYILTKTMHVDHMAWVLAVNMSTKTLQGVAEFGAERTIAFMFTYTQSGIFKRMGIEVKEDNHQSEEDSWTPVTYKKKSGPPAGAGAGAQERLPRRGGMRLGVGQRGERMGLNNGRGSEVSGAGTVGCRGGGGRCPRRQNGAGRGWQVQRSQG